MTLLLRKLIVSFVLLSQTMNVEVARSLQERQTGMMYRSEWGGLSAMLFMQPYPDTTAFWMKNTALPMAIVYLDPEWQILEIYQGVPFSEEVILSEATNVLYVLEINPQYTNLIFNNFKPFTTLLRQELKRRKIY